MKMQLTMSVVGPRGAGKVTFIKKLEKAMAGEGYKLTKRMALREQGGEQIISYWVDSPTKPEVGGAVDRPLATVRELEVREREVAHEGRDLFLDVAMGRADLP